MPAIGSEHAGVTAELLRRLIRATGPEPVLVTGTTPLRLDRYNQVRPDVLVLRQGDDDGAAPPTPADILLVIEVSDATRAFDRGRKAELYARFGIVEYWVVDLVAGQVLVHRAPAGGAYGAVELDPEMEISVKGRDLVSGIPKLRTISSVNVREALRDNLDQIGAAVLRCLERTPPELGADVLERGITLTGGGAMLNGLDVMLRDRVELPVYIAEDPLTAVVRGTGEVLENLERYRRVLL